VPVKYKSNAPQGETATVPDNQKSNTSRSTVQIVRLWQGICNRRIGVCTTDRTENLRPEILVRNLDGRGLEGVMWKIDIKICI
jgi:hypothetical protein